MADDVTTPDPVQLAEVAVIQARQAEEGLAPERELGDYAKVRADFDAAHEYAPTAKRRRYLEDQAAAQRQARHRNVILAGDLLRDAEAAIAAAVTQAEAPPDPRPAAASSTDRLLRELLVETRLRGLSEDLRRSNMAEAAARYQQAIQREEWDVVRYLEPEILAGLQMVKLRKGKTTEDALLVRDLQQLVQRNRAARVPKPLAEAAARVQAARKRYALVRGVADRVAQGPLDMDQLTKRVDDFLTRQAQTAETPGA